jgi:hypothetical protein
MWLIYIVRGIKSLCQTIASPISLFPVISGSCII